MNKYGFIRVGVAIPEVKVADCSFNIEKIANIVNEADKQQVDIVCFPELCITSYTCGDLFFQKELQNKAIDSLDVFLNKTSENKVVVIIGMPLLIKNALYNVAVVCQNGNILGLVPKINIPNSNEFYEKRWFSSGKMLDSERVEILDKFVPISSNKLFVNKNFSFGIEICEDLWNPVPPSSLLAINGAHLIFNLSASNELTGKHEYRKQLVIQQSARCNAAYAYASAGIGESSTDLVFSGAGLIAENGILLAESERFNFKSQLVVADIDLERLVSERTKNSNFNNFSDKKSYSEEAFEAKIEDFTELKRQINAHPFVPSEEKIDESCKEIILIQTAGLMKRWRHTNVDTLIVGVSGGLDSTLALLVAVKAADLLGFERKKVIGVTMPCFGTSDRTFNNAKKLMNSLHVICKEISIKDACLQHFKDIDQNPDILDITYENTQARERTQVLMDLANKYNGIVVGTGDLSELALGWATYNGDHISMYAVNNSIPKTLVCYLIEWMASQMNEEINIILKDILHTPISPELLPVDDKGNMTQFTESVVGPYELIDFFLYYFERFGFTKEKILYLARIAFKGKYNKTEIEKSFSFFIHRFFTQQFKRSCMPDGPKVGSINLSPRGDWRMPSDAVEF